MEGRSRHRIFHGDIFAILSTLSRKPANRFIRPDIDAIPVNEAELRRELAKIVRISTNLSAALVWMVRTFL